MARRPPERLAEALRANLRRRKASTPAEGPEKPAAAPAGPAPKDPQQLKDKAKIPPRTKG